MSQSSAEVRLGKSESVCSFGEESITASLLSATVHSPTNPHKHDRLNVLRPADQHPGLFLMIHGSTASFISLGKGMFRVQHKLMSIHTC